MLLGWCVLLAALAGADAVAWRLGATTVHPELPQLTIGLIVPHTNFGVREYTRAINTAVSGMHKSRGPKYNFLKRFTFTPHQVHMVLMELTPTPTGMCPESPSVLSPFYLFGDRYHIAKRLGIHPKSVKGWIIGGSGEFSVPVWSSVMVAGNRLKDLDSKIGTEDDENNWDELHLKTIQDDFMLTDMKKFTNYGIVQCTAHIIMSVLKDSRNILPVSTFADEMYGIKCCSFMSLPCLIGNRGVSHIIQQCLEEEEIELLERSACCLNQQFKELEFP